MKSLTGIKVLDLSRLLPGPFASLVLADLGAQVDKIEDPQGGDYIRHMPPLVGDTSAMFLALNRNKRSACLDLKKPTAARVFLELVRHYDVVLEQFRPGVLDRLGLSHARLLEANPRLVVCALTGYGQDGPLAHRAGHDINYLARAGVLGMQGPVSAPPQPPGFQLADIGGGLFSVIGILAALAERERTSRGKVVDVSMLESAMGFAISGLGYLLGGHPPARGDEALSGGLAIYNTYATKDGKYVSLGALEPKFWLAFAKATGIETGMDALIVGPHQAALKGRLAELFREKTRAEWEAIARDNDFCLEPVLEPSELTSDPHLASRGVFFELPSPWGTLTQWKTPLASKGETHTAPPRQGEHTRAVLAEAGIDDATIAALEAEGAIPRAAI
jgi:crotonobetainyl-CoA:carnitine CoA-transferase CaiB-like acyl-CoA transferase